MISQSPAPTCCVILQPSFLPWRGYFDQISQADVFQFFDTAQYDKHGWRNRNRIKTAQGTIWLTVPVHAHGAVGKSMSIAEVTVDTARDWRRKHRLTLAQAYRRAPFYGETMELVDQIYSIETDSLAELCIQSTTAIAAHLGISKTRYVRTSSFTAPADRNDRLVSLASQVGATRYLSGPSARAYLDEARFRAAGIEVGFAEYCYPEYPQLWPPFEPQVSILDLLFMTGPEAGRFIWANQRR